MNKIIEVFIKKDKEISKTSIFLSIATLILLILWPLQSLLVGSTFGWWVVPAFDVKTGVTVLFTLSALYVANHKIPSRNILVSPKDFKALRRDVDNLIKSTCGENKDDNRS
jgi:hypothetical protein